MAVSHINVNYVGRYAIDWFPEGSSIDRPSPAPRTSSGYIDFISRRLEEVKTNEKGLSPASQAELILLTRAILDRAKDPQGYIADVAVREDDNGISSPKAMETIYESALQRSMRTLKSAIDPWAVGKRTLDDEPPRRDAADRKAQRDVPAMYNQRCVLTGTSKPEGAHIVPTRAKYANHDLTWDALCLFWPHRRPADVTIHGQEHRNILPLTQTAHALFDAFYFALRPVTHPQTPSTRRFLQVVYLRDPDGKRITTHWDHRRFGGLCDFRRTPHPESPVQHHEPEHCSVLQHGDVFELITQNPDFQPLPSERLLQVQYGLHQIMSGIRAAGGLGDVFRGPPPDGDDASACLSVPSLWQDLIQEAQDLGILDEDAAARWGRVFAQQALQDSEDAASFVRRVLDNDSLSDYNQEDNGSDFRRPLYPENPAQLGGLRDIFRGPPPDDDDASPCPSVPPLWQDLIQEAQDLGILDEDAAARWCRAFARQALQNPEDTAGFARRALDDNDKGNENDPNRQITGTSVEDQKPDLR